MEAMSTRRPPESVATPDHGDAPLSPDASETGARDPLSLDSGAVAVAPRNETLLVLSAAQAHAGAVRTPRRGSKVFAQKAMVNLIVRFLTARELLAFGRTAHANRGAVMVELVSRSRAVDAQYAPLFDEHRQLTADYKALAQPSALLHDENHGVAGRPVDRMRTIRAKVKALEDEMDERLSVWDELQQAWQGCGIAAPAPVLSREAGYLD